MRLYDSTTVLHRNVRPNGRRLSLLGAVFVDDLPHGTNVDPIVRYCSEQANFKRFGVGRIEQRAEPRSDTAKVAASLRCPTQKLAARRSRLCETIESAMAASLSLARGQPLNVSRLLNLLTSTPRPRMRCQ